METHDSGVVNDNTGLVIGGNELNEDFNMRILPPKNPRPSRRSRKQRIESQRQGLKVQMCSKCGEIGPHKNTCRNPQANFDDDYPGDVISFEDLLAENYPTSVGVKDKNTLAW